MNDDDDRWRQYEILQGKAYAHQGLNDFDAAIFQRRAERMLAEFGLTSMKEEKIARERMVYDDMPFQYTLVERRGLLALAVRLEEEGKIQSRGGEDR